MSGYFYFVRCARCKNACSTFEWHRQTRMASQYDMPVMCGRCGGTGVFQLCVGRTVSAGRWYKPWTWGATRTELVSVIRGEGVR